VSRSGRLLRFLALAIAGGVALAALVAHYQREAIAREIINRVLRGQGIEATSLSIESLGADELRLSHLVLEQADGTTYDIRGLALPLSLPSVRPELVRIDSLAVAPGRAEPQPARPAEMLRLFLALPGVAPNTALTVARVIWPGLPPVESLVWHATEDRQRIEFSSLGIAATLAVSSGEPGRYAVVGSATADVEVLQLSVDISERDQAYAIGGAARIDLESLLAVPSVRSYAAATEGGSGRIDVDLGATLDDEAPQTVDASVTLNAASGTGLHYTPAGAAGFDARTGADAEIRIRFEYPSLEWSLASANIVVGVDAAGVGDIHAEASELDCASGLRCSFGGSVGISRLEVPGTTIRDVQASAQFAVERAESLTVRLDGFAATLTGLTGRDWSAASLSAATGAAIELELTPGGWRADLPRAAIQLGSLQFGDMTAASLSAQADLRLEPGAALRVDAMTAAAAGIAAAAWSASAVTITEPAAARVELDDTGWRADLDRVALRADVLRAGESLSASLPISLTELRVLDNGARTNATFSVAPRAATLRWGETELVAPAFDGRFEMGATYGAEVSVSNPADSIAATLALAHDPATGQGSMLLTDGALDLERTPMSKRMQRWQQAWDLFGGRLTADATLRWRELDGATVLDGKMRIGAEDVAGNVGDIVFTGLAGNMGLAVDPAEGLRGERAAMTLELLDVGVPIENIEASVQWDASDVLAVTDLAMGLLGGRVTAEPFDYRITPGDAVVLLAVESVQLPLIVKLAEFESIDMTGSLSGALPVTVAGETVTISGGRLSSDSPGGVIRYLGGAVTPADQSGVGLVSRALSNFRYDSLTADVNYTETGDLKVQMRLTGVNPDMDERQPVILNLGVENNIPQLLRSLQATRAIEDVLEKRGRK